jgi:hypothetical protein
MSSSASDNKEYEKVMPFQLPSKEEWDEATSTLKLSELGKAYLGELLLEINADIQQQELYFKNHLTRDESMEKLKDVEKAAKKLRDILVENQKLLPDFIPHKALEDIGELFAFSTINEVIGRDIRPVEKSDKMLQLMKDKNLEPATFTKQQMVAADRQLKRNAGLSDAGKLIIHVLNTLIQPIEEFHEERRRSSKGGRSPDRSRRDFILVLALNAEKIIGEKPSSDVKSKFFDLCEIVFDICGVPKENLKNLISEVLRDSGPMSNTTYL